MESHGSACPGVREEEWSRFPSNLKSGTQLGNRIENWNKGLKKSTCLSTLSTLVAFIPLTETWGLLNLGRPTQQLAVSASQKVKICYLQLAPAPCGTN